MHCAPSGRVTGNRKAKTTTDKHASLAIKELCKQYNRTLEEARCIVNTKRRVVYVLSTGHISSQDCFVNDTLQVDTTEVPAQRKKRKNNEILDDSESTSSSRPTSPTNSTSKPPGKRDKRQVLALVPDEFTVGFCAFKHTWMGVVSYQSAVAEVDGSRTKMIGMYKVTPVDDLGCAESQYESDYSQTPTGAFRQAYGKKFGDPDKCGRPNGRLFFGFHYVNMQLKLHSAFEHQFLGTEPSETSIPRKERALFDRWCGELSFRMGILPWTLHAPLVRNASSKVPASLESLLKAELVVAGLQDTGLKTTSPSGHVKIWSNFEVISSIATCSCCPKRKYTAYSEAAAGARVGLGEEGDAFALATVGTESVAVVAQGATKRRCVVLHPVLEGLGGVDAGAIDFDDFEPTTCVDLCPRSVASAIEKRAYLAYSDVMISDTFQLQQPPPQYQQHHQQQHIVADLDAVCVDNNDSVSAVPRRVFVNEGEECAIWFETLKNFDSFDLDVANMANMENAFDQCGEPSVDQVFFLP